MNANVRIKDSNASWWESFTVSSRKKARPEIQKVLDDFNSDLRPYETTRSIMKIEISKKERSTNYVTF